MYNPDDMKDIAEHMLVFLFLLCQVLWFYFLSMAAWTATQSGWQTVAIIVAIGAIGAFGILMAFKGLIELARWYVGS